MPPWEECLDCGGPIVWDGDDGHCPACRDFDRKEAAARRPSWEANDMDLNMDPAHTDSDALRKEVARYRSKITAIVQACEPFARLAKGIPHNWPGRCVLTIDEYPSGTRALNYLKEADNTTEPTIDDWRNLRDTLRWMPDVRPD